MKNENKRGLSGKKRMLIVNFKTSFPSERTGFLREGKKEEEDKQCTYSLTLRHVCATIVAVESNEYYERTYSECVCVCVCVCV